jgi:hypothetical protein
VTDEDNDEDVFVQLGDLSEPVPETFEDAMRLAYKPCDYERHSWSRRLRNPRHGRPRTDRRFGARSAAVVARSGASFGAFLRVVRCALIRRSMTPCDGSLVR